VTYATLESLAGAGRFDSKKLGGVLKQLEIDSDRPDPAAR
jgi:hypothetical protein